MERHEVDYLVEVDGELAAPQIEERLHLDPRWVDRERGAGAARRRASQRRPAAPGHRARVRRAGASLVERHLHHDRGDLDAVRHRHHAHRRWRGSHTPRRAAGPGGWRRAPAAGIPRRGRLPRTPPGSAARGRAASNRTARTWRARGRAPSRGPAASHRPRRRRHRHTSCRAGSSRRRRPARHRPRPRSRCRRRSGSDRRWRCTRLRRGLLGVVPRREEVAGRGLHQGIDRIGLIQASEPQRGRGADRARACGIIEP